MSETPPTVLIVEDDKRQREWLANYLRRELGFRVTTSETGEEALQCITENEGFDAILLDQVLPHISGLETLRRIRAASPDAFVIMVTGANLAFGLDALRAGAYRVIRKPLDLDEISFLLTYSREIRQNDLLLASESLEGAHRSDACRSPYPSCFIGYSSKDRGFAQQMRDSLISYGVKCWFAPEDMKTGDHIRPRIDESIHSHDRLLLVLSERSVASAWVEQEVETALERERRQGKSVLFPIRLDDAVMAINTGWPALIRNTRHIGDFTRWKEHDAYQVAFERLLRDLKAEGG